MISAHLEGKLGSVVYVFRSHKYSWDVIRKYLCYLDKQINSVVARHSVVILFLKSSKFSDFVLSWGNPIEKHLTVLRLESAVATRSFSLMPEIDGFLKVSNTFRQSNFLSKAAVQQYDLQPKHLFSGDKSTHRVCWLSLSSKIYIHRWSKGSFDCLSSRQVTNFYLNHLR